MCALAGVSRAGYYRHWQASAPRQEETALRDAIQRLALANRHYGYRRIAAQLRREGWRVNHKRVLRLMREDNLLCLRKPPFVPATTDSRHGWRVWPNLARGLMPDRPRPALGGRHHLCAAAGGVRLSGRRARRLQPQGRRLGDGDASEGEPGHGGARDGLAAAPAAPGSLIHHSDRGVQYACGDYAALPRGPRHPAQHEPGRQSLRQRQGRELHEDAQARRGRRQRLSRRQHATAAIGSSSRRSTIANGFTRPWPICRQSSSRPAYLPRGYP